MKILLVNNSENNPDICRVSFEDGSSVQILTELLLSMNLSAGSEISTTDLEKLKTTYNYGKSLNYVLSLLSRGIVPSKKVEIKLKRRNADNMVIDAILSRLKRDGLLDDLEYSRSWIRSRRKNAPRSDTIIEYELTRKGVSRDVVLKALEYEGSVDSEDEIEAVWNSYSTKLIAYNTMPAIKKRRCVSGFLKRRGFSWETVNSVLEKLKNYESN